MEWALKGLIFLKHCILKNITHDKIYHIKHYSIKRFYISYIFLEVSKAFIFSSKSVIEISVTKPILRSCYLLSHVPFNVKFRQKPVIYILFSEQVLSQRETLKKVWNTFKVTNDENRTTSIISFSCFYCYLRTYLTPFSTVSIADFKQVNAGWTKSSSFRQRNISK